MRHFVDIIKYNVPKITSVQLKSLLGEGINCSPRTIDDYSTKWYYKDYLDIVPKRDITSSTIRYTYVSRSDNSVGLNSYKQFIDIHAALTSGLIRYYDDTDGRDYYVAVTGHNIISSEWIDSKFDVFEIENPGAHSLSIQYTDYVLQIFKDNGSFIAPDKNFAMIYNFTNKNILILLPKTDLENTQIHVILKPRRLSLNADMVSILTKNKNTNLQYDLKRQYNIDEIIPIRLDNGSEIPSIYKYEYPLEMPKEIFNDTVGGSNEVIIQFQKAYFKYLNHKYDWKFRNYNSPTNSVSIILNNLETTYGGGEFNQKYDLDPGLERKISESSITATDLVQNQTSYNDFYKFNNSTDFLDFLKKYIDSGRNILDLDIFKVDTSIEDGTVIEDGTKFIQYCDFPIKSLISLVGENTKLYVYVSNVNSKKIKMQYTYTANTKIDDHLVYHVIESLETTEYDEKYFNNNTGSFSLKKYYDPDQNRENIHLYYLKTPSPGADENLCCEIEYYVEDNLNNIVINNDEGFTAEPSNYDETNNITNAWEYEELYLNKHYPKIEIDGKEFYQANTNLDDIFIPSGMNPRNLNFIIQSIATSAIKSGGKALRNNFNEEIESYFRKDSLDSFSDDLALNNDVFFTKDYLNTANSNFESNFANAIEYLTKNNNISIQISFDGNTVCRYSFMDNKPEDADDVWINDPGNNITKNVVTTYSVDKLLCESIYRNSNIESTYQSSMNSIIEHSLIYQYMRPDIIYERTLSDINIADNDKDVLTVSDSFTTAYFLKRKSADFFDISDITKNKTMIKENIETFLLCKSDSDIEYPDDFKQKLKFLIKYNIDVTYTDTQNESKVAEIAITLCDIGLISLNNTAIETDETNIAMFYLVGLPVGAVTSGSFEIFKKYFKTFFNEYYQDDNEFIPINNITGIEITNISIKNESEDLDVLIVSSNKIV